MSDQNNNSLENQGVIVRLIKTINTTATPFLYLKIEKQTPIDLLFIVKVSF